MYHSRYVDAVKPGRYGIPKPLYFPLLPSYWTGKARKVYIYAEGNTVCIMFVLPMYTVYLQSSAGDAESSGWHDPQAHEEEPTDREAGIKIQNLTKVYDQVTLDRPVVGLCIVDGQLLSKMAK